MVSHMRGVDAAAVLNLAIHMGANVGVAGIIFALAWA
jgi:hypothetical protein